MSVPVQVLFLAAEAEPFMKIGGLADVAGSLPLALRNLPAGDILEEALDVRLVLPLHSATRVDNVKLELVTEFIVRHQREDLKARVFSCSFEGLPVYFISGAPITDARSVYSSDPAPDRFKYTFFSLAALEVLKFLGWRQAILHANDWHTAVALYAVRKRPCGPVNAHLHTLLTLHNLPYMGGEGSDVLNGFGLPALEDESLPAWARSQPLPLGLWSADVIVPVSPTYAQEILTPNFGCGLEHFLNARSGKIVGILNGLDIASFDPASDAALARNFSTGTLALRGENKLALQRHLGLPVDARVPLLAMVGRIDQQKGVDLALAALSEYADRSWQFVLLGSGFPELEAKARELQSSLPGRVRAVLRYDADLGRKIYGGADLFLMPSRYEPCGLAQMIAMRYGAVPVVRATGGLKDTVQEGRTGFLFEGGAPASLQAALDRALQAHGNRDVWSQFQSAGMQADFSWSRSAHRYAEIYRSLFAGTQANGGAA